MSDLTPNQVAEELGLSAYTIAKRLRSDCGKPMSKRDFPNAYKAGHGPKAAWRVPAKDVDRFRAVNVRGLK